jgi:hypothetical protein
MFNHRKNDPRDSRINTCREGIEFLAGTPPRAMPPPVFADKRQLFFFIPVIRSTDSCSADL